MYWVSYILGGWHHYSEDDEKDDGVSVMKSVDDVVIIAYIDFCDTSDSADQTVHHHGGRVESEKNTALIFT